MLIRTKARAAGQVCLRPPPLFTAGVGAYRHREKWNICAFVSLFSGMFHILSPLLGNSWWIIHLPLVLLLFRRPFGVVVAVGMKFITFSLAHAYADSNLRAPLSHILIKTTNAEKRKGMKRALLHSCMCAVCMYTLLTAECY